jgi:membrane associated rhomboid family serine protease
MLQQLSDTVKHLLILNIILFVGAYALPQINDLFALHYIETHSFKWWQLVTHMFMHGSPMHLFFNMFALVSFGTALERFWGMKKFLFFYFSCGFGAAFIQMGYYYYEVHALMAQLSDLNITNADWKILLNTAFNRGDLYEGQLLFDGAKAIFEKYPTMNSDQFKVVFDTALKAKAAMVGASGAIYGLLVAFAFMFPNAELALLFIPVPIKAKYFVPVIVLIDLFSGVTGMSAFGGGIAHFAHVGGALVGFLMMWYWKNNKFNDHNSNRWN